MIMMVGIIRMMITIVEGMKVLHVGVVTQTQDKQPLTRVLHHTV